jgi:nucleolar GTP-binding protein
LVKIENSDFYLDVAFRKAKEKGDSLRGSKIRKDRLAKSKYIEISKLETINNSLIKNLNKILTSYPKIDQLPEFYNELIKCTLDYAILKKSLGAVNWAVKKINLFFNLYKEKIKKTKDIRKINVYRREFYGRISSVVKQIKNELFYLEEARKIMKDYPSIKTSLITIAVSGFPNVGKTTLLYKLTGSKPEINSYAFTTKNINIGYLKIKDKKIQLLDTPGSLNRFNKMNNIEKQAYLAIKYLANLIIYVFDLTEPYPLKDQIKLYNNLKEFNKKIIVYFSKTDVLDKKKVDEFRSKYE